MNTAFMGLTSRVCHGLPDNISPDTVPRKGPLPTGQGCRSRGAGCDAVRGSSAARGRAR